jgi:hypothetical protein
MHSYPRWYFEDGMGVEKILSPSLSLSLSLSHTHTHIKTNVLLRNHILLP